ncbi:MAG: NAD(+) synthase [Acidobacteriia bacterium]|nr:NAD(+) synthase [Terriglobia bacterium]
MFSKRVLELDGARVVGSLAESIRRIVVSDLKRRGAVVGISGGIDSSLVAALCARALTPGRVVGLLMPDRDSSHESLELAGLLASRLGIRTETVELGPALDAMGCYRYRDDAIRSVIPEFAEGWRSKIVLPPITGSTRLNVFQVVAQAPSGATRRARLPLEAYLEVVAASNMKQRARTLTEYFHAERHHYAVAGTPNRLEYDQGFFVKGGDGLADFKPIAHLYKTQVYALAAELDVPEEIRRRPPTTDTYSMPQTQEEFYFALPYDRMDLCLWAHNHGVPAAEVAPVVGITEAEVRSVYDDIESKRRTTRYLHLPPVLVEEVPEVRRHAGAP